MSRYTLQFELTLQALFSVTYVGFVRQVCLLYSIDLLIGVRAVHVTVSSGSLSIVSETSLRKMDITAGVG